LRTIVASNRIALLTSIAGVAFGTDLARLARCAGGTAVTLVAFVSLVSLLTLRAAIATSAFAGVSLIAFVALRAGRALVSDRPHVSLRTLFALRPGRISGADERPVRVQRSDVQEDLGMPSVDVDECDRIAKTPRSSVHAWINDDLGGDIHGHHRI
jgi:hypothetical protein